MFQFVHHHLMVGHDELQSARSPLKTCRNLIIGWEAKLCDIVLHCSLNDSDLFQISDMELHSLSIYTFSNDSQSVLECFLIYKSSIFINISRPISLKRSLFKSSWVFTCPELLMLRRL